MTAETKPYDWLKSVESSLLRNELIPLTGKSPQFPWEEFNSLFSRTLKQDHVHISTSSPEWREAENVRNGLGANPKSLQFFIPPLQGSLVWFIGEDDIALLAQLLLIDNSEAAQAPFVDEDLLNGFHRFLAVEALNAIDCLHYLRDLSPILSDDEIPPFTGTILTFNIKIVINDRTISGRLCLSQEFYQSWSQHHAAQPEALTPELLSKIQVNLSAVIGHTVIKSSDWDAIEEGDILLLDSCSVDPESYTGIASLAVNGHPVFKGRLADGKIELAEDVQNAEPFATIDSLPPPTTLIEENEPEKIKEEIIEKEENTKVEESPKEEPTKKDSLEENAIEVEDTSVEKDKHEENPIEAEDTSTEKKAPSKKPENDSEDDDFNFEDDDDFDFDDDDDDF